MKKDIVSAERIAGSIYFIRGQKVLLDFDLASLYGVATKVLNQAVQRNRTRFPEDFMFRLNAEEFRTLKSQFVIPDRAVDKPPISHRSQSVTSSQKHRARSHRLYAFAELGVAMLSSVLRSQRAVQVKIAPEKKSRREIGSHVRETAPRYGTRQRR